MGDDNQERECAVCLQKCHHPTELPCGHIFCFLCVKGMSIQTRKCAMCRAVIPRNYLENPVLLENLSPDQKDKQQESQSEYQWYYEGRNGWWKYDERSNMELEESFNNGSAECTLLLAGALYCIDFESMTQLRCSDLTRRRRVRRDTAMFPSKGVAGIKVIKTESREEDTMENGLNTDTTNNLSGSDVLTSIGQDCDNTQVLDS